MEPSFNGETSGRSSDDQHVNDIQMGLAKLRKGLLSYQREGLNWALKQENSKFRGGILGANSEMENITQIISLVVTKQGVDQSSLTLTSKLPPRGTLIICPTSAVQNWEDKIRNSTQPGTVKVFVYQGPKRVKDYSQFHGYDIVVTSYNTLAADNRIPRQEKKVDRVVGCKSPLHYGKWERIVLDEAHSIKGTNITKAIFALESSYKWAIYVFGDLTGDLDLYPLIRFLQVVPYSYYLCKDCSCRILDYSSAADCNNCRHKPSKHFSWWNKNVTENAGKADQQKILANIVRLIEPYSPRTISTRTDCLEVTENTFYCTLLEEMNRYVQGGNVRDYHGLCDLFGRLLKATNHRYLVAFSRPSFLINNGNQQICCICLAPIKDPTVLRALEEPLCPSCSRSATTTAASCSRSATTPAATTTEAKGFRSSTSIVNKIHLDFFQTSTKIEALREEIRFMIERKGSSKAIVYSQLTSFLHLIMYSLQKSDVDCVILESGMSGSEIETSIKRFNKDDNCRILLFGLKSGVAESLTIASQVFLLDSWGSPAFLQQLARDRTWRHLRILKLVIEDTIEERILALQEKKGQPFDRLMGGYRDGVPALSKEELKKVFGY